MAPAVCENLSSADLDALREMEHDDILRRALPRKHRRTIVYWAETIAEIYLRVGTSTFQYVHVSDLGGRPWFMSSLHTRGYVDKVGVDRTGVARWRLTAEALRVMAVNREVEGSD